MSKIMTGRPSSYTPETGQAICDRLVCGKDELPESLRSICRDDDMPELRTVMRWLASNDEFRQQYTRARELQQELSGDDIMDIADNSTDDVMYLTADDESGESGRAVIKHSAIARAKLQIDTRKWVMSKLAPKKYGDSTQIKHADANGEVLTLSGILSEINGSTADLPRDEEIPE